ncbi:MAG: selenide, water dikinase SelD [Bacteroidia bacterium]|nr:MAG: selenide, water dikinase SelD [Bacteroidia bacterium]
MKTKFDLLSTIEYGGCSAKLPAGLLSEVLSKLQVSTDPRLLVDVDTHDDAGVYKISEDTALIFTTDFFPPICSDAYEFGEIAAANALSDVYAMGGTPLMALNLMMFSQEKIPLEVFGEILRGGQHKVSEAGALVVGGHTIDDHPPKFGLAVIGTIHPDKLITNAGAMPGDLLVLTKPIGTGALVSGMKSGICSLTDYKRALEQMKQLNKLGAELAVKYGVNGMTDITGFGLAGHAMKMAEASKVSFRMRCSQIPLLPGAYQVFEKGSIPGATFRNLEFTGSKVHFTRGVTYNLKMLMHDAQTSGGLLMSVNPDHADQLVKELNDLDSSGESSIVGEVLMKSPRTIYFE